MLTIKLKTDAKTLFEAGSVTEERANKHAHVAAEAIAGAMTGRIKDSNTLSILQDVMDKCEPETIEEAVLIAFSFGRAAEHGISLMKRLQSGDGLAEILSGLTK